MHLNELRFGGCKPRQIGHLVNRESSSPRITTGTHFEPSLFSHCLARDSQIDQSILDVRELALLVVMNPIVAKVAIAVQSRLVEPQRDVVSSKASRLFSQRDDIRTQRIR